MYNTIKKIIKYKYFNNIYFNYIILISQLLIVIGYIIFICINSKINTLVIDTNIKLLLYISEFIGIFIYLNSILLFILIFVKTLQEIYIINETIDDNIVNNNKKGLVKFFYNIIDLKNKITYTISDFNYILNIFTIINLFSLGLLYHIYDSLSINQKIYFYILSGYFIIIDSICLFIILYISHIKNEIFNKIYDPLFVNNFIKKYDITTFNDTFNIQIDINQIDINNITLYNVLEENSTSIDWIILNITLNSKWTDFNLFGIKVHSIDSIGKIMFMIALFYKIIL